MGLAEPRKRLKIAHDPRNLAWTNSTDSYGQRLMQKQGWQAGNALGKESNNRHYRGSEAAKVVVHYKDDTLGLGATLKSKDIAHQRTGFDAFQGLLGRLNAKTEEEVKAVEKKLEDKNLAMFAQGRWGGMVFVPGGLLVQTDPYKQKLALETSSEAESPSCDNSKPLDASTDNNNSSAAAERSQRRAERKRRREDRRLRKEEKRRHRASEAVKSKEQAALPTPDPSSSNEELPEGGPNPGKRKPPSPGLETVSAQQPKLQMKNGRHIIRGKNILAKRAAFADLKGLDEIFMRIS